MKKKLISLVILCVLALSAGIYYYIRQLKNIFDEIYQETKKTYRSNNILGQIEDFEIQGSWSTDDSNISKTPFGKYKADSLPEGYSEIEISFNFGEGTKGESIRFEWQPNSDITIWYLCHYKQDSKTFTKEIAIFDEPRKAGEYIDDETQVKAYLEQYHISSVDLDNYYNEIVNQKVLTDWCSIYDSQFSPEDYGNVTVKTQWENW